jgi:hypothetical protein
MNIEEREPEDKIKGQVKLLVERIRTIENRQTQVEKELTQFKSDVTEQREIFTSTMNDAFNQVQVVIAEFNSFKPSLSTLGGMKADFDSFSSKLEHMTQSLETIQSNITSQLSSLQGEINSEITSLQQSIQKGEKFQSSVTSQLSSFQEELNSELSNLHEKLTQLEGSISDEGDSVSRADFDNLKTELEKRFVGIGNRVENVEKHAGITSGALMETSFDSGGMLRELVNELFGSDMIDSLMPENIADPVPVVKSIKKLIMSLCGMDDSRIPNISDILLRYAEKMEGSGVSGRRELFIAFNTDVRRVCEIGQSVLMAIGQKRNFSRRICQEANNLAGKWTSEEIIQDTQGVKAVLELFDTLEQEFSEP